MAILLRSREGPNGNAPGHPAQPPVPAAAAGADAVRADPHNGGARGYGATQGTHREQRRGGPHRRRRSVNQLTSLQELRADVERQTHTPSPLELVPNGSPTWARPPAVGGRWLTSGPGERH